MSEIYNIGVKEYNAYLICGNINVIVDTVPRKFFEEFKKNIEEHVSLQKVDSIVFGRTTPDAAGAVADLLCENRSIKVFATVAGLKNLKEIVNGELCENVIKNGGEIELGDDCLKFFVSPNLSWPDTAFFLLQNKRALLCGNLFCESPEQDAFQKVFLKRAVEQINSLKLDRAYPAYGEFLGFDMYDEFLNEKEGEEIAVVFESCGGNTRLMAKTVAEELARCGKKTVLLDVGELTQEAVIKRTEGCKAFLFGTNTINHSAGKRLLNVICGMNVLKISDKKAFVFGSYGWSGEGVGMVISLISSLKMKPDKKPFRVIFTPSAENLEKLRKEVRKFAEDI